MVAEAVDELCWLSSLQRRQRCSAHRLGLLSLRVRTRDDGSLHVVRRVGSKDRNGAGCGPAAFSRRSAESRHHTKVTNQTSFGEMLGLGALRRRASISPSPSCRGSLRPWRLLRTCMFLSRTGIIPGGCALLPVTAAMVNCLLDWASFGAGNSSYSEAVL